MEHTSPLAHEATTYETTVPQPVVVDDAFDPVAIGLHWGAPIVPPDHPLADMFKRAVEDGFIRLAPVCGMLTGLMYLSYLWSDLLLYREHLRTLLPVRLLLAGSFLVAAAICHWHPQREVRLRTSQLTVTLHIRWHDILLLKKTEALLDEQHTYNRRIEHDLVVARQIQQSLLPAAYPAFSGLDVACYSMAASEVGGDFYAYHEHPDQRVLIGVGDVSGKGLPAALIMSTCVTIFSTAATHGDSPRALLTYGELHWIDVGGLPLGFGQGAIKGYQQHEYHAQPGDTLLLCSDGVLEAHNTAGELLGFERLEAALATCPLSGASAILNTIRSELSRFTADAHQHDDITLIVIRVL